MPSRTEIVCLCEGAARASIDPVFINKLIKSLNPSWVRKKGSNWVRPIPCGGRNDLIARFPGELTAVLRAGGDTTLMVWADCDDDCLDGDSLKAIFWKEAKQAGIGKEEFDRVVFVFAKDRLENWIEFLQTGKTDEEIEGPRVKHSRGVAEAARRLADLCGSKERRPSSLPPSLEWSCRNRHTLVARMKAD